MEQMEKQRLLIDTDMGNDDIMAICMLLLNPNIQIEGFSVTSGVSNAQIGVRNLLRILSYCNRNIPVAIGPEREFQTELNFPQRDIQRAEELILLSDLNIPEINQTLSRSLSFEELMDQVIRESFTLLVLGPLTNIATMIQLYPQIENNLESIILMGGGIKQGNVPPKYEAEYNIALDPKSADQVFSSGISTILVGIDATSKVPATLEFKNKLARVIPQTKEGKIIKAIVLENDGDLSAFYDPLAANILADPSIVTQSSTGSIRVVQNGLKQGKTVFTKEPNGNVNVVFDCNSQEFYGNIEELSRKAF